LNVTSLVVAWVAVAWEGYCLYNSRNHFWVGCVFLLTIKAADCHGEKICGKVFPPLAQNFIYLLAYSEKPCHDIGDFASIFARVIWVNLPWQFSNFTDKLHSRLCSRFCEIGSFKSLSPFHKPQKSRCCSVGQWAGLISI
jgi:hypothetical protein